MIKKNRTPNSIWVLSAALACIGAGQSTIFILVPQEIRLLGFNEFQVGLIFSISALAWIFFSPFWGRLSDRIGRSKVFMLGIIGFAISLFLFAAIIKIAQIYPFSFTLLFVLLICARLINGLLGSAVRPSAGGRIADITDTTNRTSGFARLDAGWQFGVVLGPVAVGMIMLLSDNNLLMPFIFLSLLGLVIGFLNFKLLKKDDSSFESNTDSSALKFTDKRVFPSLVIASFLGISNACIVLTSSLFVNDVILKSTEDLYFFVSIGFAIVALSGLLTQLLIVDRYSLDPKILVFIGLSLMTLIFYLLSSVNDISSFYILLAIFGFGGGLARPGNVSILSLSINKNEQGSASGLMGTVFPLGHLLTPFSIMPLYMINPSYPYLLISVLGLFLLLYMFYNQKVFFKFIKTGVREDV
jgi:MFS family permease